MVKLKIFLNKNLTLVHVQSLMNNSKLLGVITLNKSITGLSMLNSELFVVEWESTKVKVYDVNDFTWTRDIDITLSSSLCTMVAS